MENKFDKKDIEKIKALVKKGDIEAAYNLGMIYKDEGDYENAIKYFEIAAKGKNGQAYYQLGLLYFDDEHVKPDYKKALDCFENAAFFSEFKGAYKAGIIYENGYDGVEKNYEKALLQYLLAKENGVKEADDRLKELGYYNEPEPPESQEPDYKSMSIDELEAELEAGNLIVYKYIAGYFFDKEQYEKAFVFASEGYERTKCNRCLNVMGICYSRGLYVEKDEKKAFELIKKAAENGDESAECNLGICYLRGIGVEAKLFTALDWFKKSASHGYKRAYTILGDCYCCGNYPIEDYELALKYYKEAVAKGEKGLEDKLSYLEFLVAPGDFNKQKTFKGSLTVDYRKMDFETLKKRFDEGDYAASYRLGVIYRKEKKQYKEAYEAFYTGFKKIKHAFCATNLGLMFHKGEFVPKNDNIAASYFGYADRLGDYDATFNLGWMFENGVAVAKDIDEAIRYYQKGASLGHKNCLEELQRLAPEVAEKLVVKDYRDYSLEELEHLVALSNDQCLPYLALKYEQEKQYKKAADLYYKYFKIYNSYFCASRLGYLFYFGDGVKVDYDKAFRLFSFAEPSQTGINEYCLGLCYYYGHGTQEDFKKAVVHFQKAADKNMGKAMTHLGRCYRDGDGVAQDYHKAFYYFKKAEERGDEDVSSYLAYAYENGQGVEKNYSKMVEYYCKSIKEQDSAYSMTNLAYAYEIGRGVRQNYNEAFKLFYKAALKENSFAMFKVGVFYFHGWGINQDYKESYNWLLRAANAGEEAAYGCIGYLYYEGFYVNRDYSQTIYWCKKGAEAGDSYAQFVLGCCYIEGNGVYEDESKARYWWQKAADQGCQYAIDALNEIDDY